MKWLLGAITLMMSTFAPSYAAEQPAGISVSIIDEANQLLKKGELDAALVKLNSLIKKEENNARAFKLRGNVLFAMGNYDSALADLTKVISLRPKDAKAYFDRGIVYFAVDNEKLALEDLKQAFIMNPQLAKSFESKPDVEAGISEVKEDGKLTKLQVRTKRGLVSTKKGSVVLKK